ncbi:MAG TPA: YXWGXW repeat-containing protein [Terriglobales bacterium]|nr:YXWGXW repeat-containing protein [Terriglobales bacterium]
MTKRSVGLAMLALMLLAIPTSSFAGVFISVRIAPPALPVYTQPPCPGDGYIWTPGYWAYGPVGYYWVPGTWVVAPEPGLLWTPGYWGWTGGAYLWHAGYWGPHVGFYGGVNYGFGYTGVGFFGGEWRSGHFFYNRSVSNVTITNVHVYNRVVVNNVTVNRVAFNGGPGGIERRPSADEERWGHERHFEATHVQMEHENGARNNRELWASENHGRPAIAATGRPGEFHGPHAVPARAAAPRPENRPMENRAMNRPRPRPQNNVRMERQNNRPDNHGGPTPRPSSYHENNHPQPHENARPQERHEQERHEPHGH